MVKEFVDYTPLSEALRTLQGRIRTPVRVESVPVVTAHGRVLHDDVVSTANVPVMDSSHMDGFAVRSADVAHASPGNPVTLKVVRGPGLGIVPTRHLRSLEAQTVVTGGYVPEGADAVVQSEKVREGEKRGTILVSIGVPKGDFVFPKGRDISKGERVLQAGRVLTGVDLVLLASLHIERISVRRKPRVAIIPTGSELSPRIRGTEPGKVVETHGLLLSRLVEGAGGVPIPLPIARDNLPEIERRIKRGLHAADLVLTLAGSSVGEPDLTGRAIDNSGKPGVLVHGMRVFRGRVMGFGAIGEKVVIILPGPIQGAVNAFALMAYPVIRSMLGRGFEEPPSLPAIVASEWEAGPRYSDFAKVVYCRIRTGDEIMVEPSKGETEKVTHMTQNDGYLLVGEEKKVMRKGERVRVHLLPGLSPSYLLPA